MDELVTFDEPTTALDVTTQIEVLRVFKTAIKERGTTAVYVTHDLAVVAQMADRIIVLRDGAIREVDATGRILNEPKNDYTKSLLAAAEPQVRVATSEALQKTSAPPVLEVKSVVVGYGPVDREGVPAPPVLRDVGLTIKPRTTLGVIGESGCGKSTLARVIAGLLPAARGEVLLDGAPLPRRASFARSAAPHPDRVPEGGYRAQPGTPDQPHPRAAARVLSRPRRRQAGAPRGRASRHGAPAGDHGRALSERAVRRAEVARQSRKGACRRTLAHSERRGHLGARHRGRRGDPQPPR